ncbi:MAG: alpha/beta hydrolase [Chloroflexota bacterium]|nr:alpha/beta hydrolase [Chloroflexota bacterium]
MRAAIGEGIQISTPRGPVIGILHRAEGARAALLMVGGAGGGLNGPAGIYEKLARQVRQDGITGLRLDYRKPNHLQECVYDVLAGLEALKQLGVERAALVGWSFGGAVVITAGAESDTVVGVATVASQTYGTEAVSRLSPKSLLLIHGTADRTLPDRCSRDLYRRAGEPKELVLYDGDNHGIDRHRTEMLRKLYEWSRRLLRERSETGA